MPDRYDPLYYRAHREHISEAQQARRAARPEQYREYGRRYRRSVKGRATRRAYAARVREEERAFDALHPGLSARQVTKALSRKPEPRYKQMERKRRQGRTCPLCKRGITDSASFCLRCSNRRNHINYAAGSWDNNLWNAVKVYRKLRDTEA